MPHDPLATPTPEFPNLTSGNHRITSPSTPAYNCVAWAAGDATRWWEPGTGYWPVPVEGGGWFGDLLRAFESLGYTPCPTGEPEAGYAKVALFAQSAVIWTHAARQLPSGTWTSKLGRSEDIEHDAAEAVAGGVYGQLLQFLRRPLPPG